MKKILLMLAVISITAGNTQACDICGCSGAGMFNMPSSYALYNFLLMRPHYSTFNTTGEADARVTFAGVDIGGGFGLNKWWHLTAYVPVKMNTILHEQVERQYMGLGDAGVINTFRIYSNLDSMMAKHKYNLFVKAGVELPTGAFNRDFRTENMPAGISTGSGSIDFMSGLRAVYQLKKHSVNIDYTAKYNLPNALAYQFGFQQSATVLYSYTIRKPKCTILPNVGVLAESTSGDMYHDMLLPETKGASAFAMAGIELGFNDWVTGVQVDLPTADTFDGELSYQPRFTMRVLYLMR